MGSRYTGDFVKPGAKPKVASKYVGYGTEASKGQGKGGGAMKGGKKGKAC